MEMYGYKCQKCGYINYPYRLVCKKCKQNDTEAYDAVELPKKGKLVTYTRLYSLAADFEVPSLQLGIVELENGTKVTAQLNIKEPKTGMSVVGHIDTVRKSAYNEHKGMIFVQE